jgi:hypothetical protein
MYKSLTMKILFCALSSTLLTTTAFSQKTGIKKAEFFPEKVIVTEEVTTNGEVETTITEIEAPKNYTAMRGDRFLFALPAGKFDRNGKKKQTIAVVNLSTKSLQHFDYTYVGKDTIQLPDEVITTADHFSVFVKDFNSKKDKNDIWLDNRGFLVLQVASMPKHGSELGYQESYNKNNNSGVIRSLGNGQFSFITKWQVNKDDNENLTINVNTIMSERNGGFSMSIEYIIDKEFNPLSYVEHWEVP